MKTTTIKLFFKNVSEPINVNVHAVAGSNVTVEAEVSSLIKVLADAMTAGNVVTFTSSAGFVTHTISGADLRMVC